MNRDAATISRIYGAILRLYPRSFRASFASEMEAVFAQALDDAARQGMVSVLVVCLRELVDLPMNLLLEHHQEKRKKAMKLFRYDEAQGIRITRWIARIGSLTMNILFYIIILTTHQQAIFNLTIVVMSAALLVAWRRERIGGLLMLAAAVTCAITVGIHGMFSVEHLGLLKTLLWGLLCMLGVLAFWLPEYLIFGWLFVSLARRDRMMQSAQYLPSVG